MISKFVRENGKKQKWNQEKPIITYERKGKEVVAASGKLVGDVVAESVARVGM